MQLSMSCILRVPMRLTLESIAVWGVVMRLPLQKITHYRLKIIINTHLHMVQFVGSCWYTRSSRSNGCRASYKAVWSPYF